MRKSGFFLMSENKTILGPIWARIKRTSWVVEPELNWERQVQREQDEIEDDPEPNSMYSLVRLFDKKKMEYFDENYKQSHLYLSQRKFNKDCLDGNNQVKLINKIIGNQLRWFYCFCEAESQ